MGKFKKTATFIKEDALYNEMFTFVNKLITEHPKGIQAQFEENNNIFRVDISHCDQKTRLEMLENGFEEI